MKKFFKNLMPMLLLVAGLGISPNLWAITVNGGTFYLDNSKTNWSQVALFVGKDGNDKYTSVYTMNKITNTKLYYYNMSSWGGATYIRYTACTGWDSGSWGPENYNCGDGFTATYTGNYTFNSNSLYLFVPASGNKDASISPSYISSYSDFNKTQTIKAKVSTDGGSNYSDVTTSPGTLSANSKKFSNYNTCGTATSLSSGKITCGYTATTTLTAADATGYTFVAWYKGSSQVSTNKSITIYPTDEDTYYAYYKENRYDITATVNDANMGSATPTTATAMGQISGGDITATNNIGYHFVNWEVGTATGTFEDDSETSTTFKPTKEGTVVANFTEVLTSVTISSNGNGTVSPTSASVGVATTESVSATPADGYHFDSWAVTGNADIKGATTSNPVTLYGNGSGSTGTLTATFAENTHNITISTDGNGSTDPTGAKSNVGEVTGISITATPNDGFGFKGWEVTGGTISANTATTTFYPTADNATIRATFQSTAVYYDLTIGVCSSQGATQGSISSDPAAGTHIQAGTAFTLTATPAIGYEVEGWYSDAACTGAKLKTGGTTYELTLSANTTVYVRFVDHKYDLKVSHQYYPNNSGSRDGSLDAHDTFNDVIGKETGYNVNTASKVRTGYYHNNWVLNANASVTVGGKTTTAEGSTATIQGATATSTTLDIQSGYAIPGEVVNVLDRWKEYARTVNVSATVGGSIEGGATSVSNIGYDTKQSVTAVKGEGYDFTGWTKTDNTNYTINIESPSTLTTNITVTSDESEAVAGLITANFVPQVYNITYMDKGGVAFTGLHEENYPIQHTYDQVTQLKGATKTGYQFDGWFNNSACTGEALTEIGATAYTANFTLYAKWTEVLYDVTINTSNAEGATLKIEDVDADWGSVVKVGVVTSKSITVTPNPGYKLNSFTQTGGGSVSGNGTSFTVKSTGSNGTVTANPVETPTVFFKNTLGWSNVYVIFFNENAYREWDNIQGVHPHRGKDRVAEYGTLTLVPGTTDIYYCSYDAAKITTGYIAFSNADMHTWNDFSGNKASYRGDFASCQPLFIPNTNQTSKDNNTEYYSDGRWTSYSTASEIYMVGINDDWSERDQYQFEKETITATSYTLDVTLSNASANYEFKLRKCGDGDWYGVDANTTITSANCTNIQFGSDKSSNCKITTTVAGTYKFTYDITTKKLSVEYPAMPAPASITVTAERYFGEEKIDNFIATDPYQVYTDETIKLTIDAVAAPTGCTTYYQFGENAASTERTYIISNITNIASSIDAKVFFRPTAGGKDSEAKTETINYIGVFAPSINLTTSWKDHNEEAQEGVDVPENVTIYYNAANYTGSAIVTRKQDNLEPETFMTIASGEQANKTYTLENQNVQRQTFVATATVNGRTFTATKSISVYRLVEITITDAKNLMTHYYMWENGTNPLREEEKWPGKEFFSRLGNAHIFYVKYPSYTHFVLNNGKNAGEGDAIQTVNVALPDQSACYKIGELITEEENPDNGKYAVQEAGECPNKLYVGDIAPVAALQGEGVLVSPQVDIDPLLNADDLRITFNYKSATGITCDQRGRNFMVTATSTGAKSISVTYSIDGANTVTKDVTVNVTNAIMVQVKVPTFFGWNDHNDMWVYYFGHGAEGHIRMSWKDCVDSFDRFSARVPLGSGDKVNFLFHEWTLDGNQPWQQTTNIEDVTTDGCYTLSDGGEGQKRNWTRNGNDCWTEYYVEIDMNNGTVYRSNKVEDLANTVSFYAPTSDKGSIRIMQNGTQKTVISPSDHQTLFATAGVYTAKITTDGTGLSDVTPYTGDYYIRTDAATTTASGDDFSDGWSNYKNDNHKFSQFTLFDDALYDYYWVNNCKRTKSDGKLNIKGCVANDYNDNLANMIESDTYTEDDGSIQGNTSTGINLRFGYNPATNYFERAALTGSTSEGGKFLNIIGENVYNKQNRQEELNEANYNDHPEYSKMEDDGDWIYEKTVFVKIDVDHGSSQIYLKSLINSKELYQLGYKTDNFGRKTSELKKRTIMGQGSSNGEYALRIVYDFKQNRILSSWSPIGELKVTKDLTIDADVMFIRHENEGTAHIIFENKSAKVTSLQNVYFVLELDKYVGAENERNYWFTVPFDVKVGDIFGVENYVTLDADNEAIDGSWGILRYDGYTRSKKGWFIEDTPEGFWEWMDKDEVLTAGTGYVLVFDKKDFEWKEFDEVIPCDDLEDPQCEEGKKTIKHAIKRIYFPSQVKGFSMSNASENPIIYADEPCTITKPFDRTKEDSNWKVIGPMSYNDIKVAESDVETYEGGKEWPNFLYLYEEDKGKGSRYTPTQGYGEGFTYQAFHGYMTQYAGTITWKDMSVTNPSSAPRFAEEPSFKGGTMTIELVQNNEQLDRTFVKLSKNGTEGFDQNLDLMKITDKCAQIASVSEDALYAGNTLPLDIEMVPLNVKVVANGTYDIALVQSLEGLEVRLLDAFEQTTTVLDMMPATVTLNKGEYKDRFFLQFVQKSPLTPTNFNGTIEQFNLPTDKTQKLLINDNIYLINGGRVYNASGTKVR